MADSAQKRIREEFLKNQEAFRENAFIIIMKMDDWSNMTPGSKHLVDEILHSIFFLGKINQVSFSPEEIISDGDILDALKKKYPKPFKFYLAQLPRRSPFSCVLDMMVLHQKPENEEQIKQSLRDLINSLDPHFLVSSTICISQKSNNSTRHYGVSMSTTGPNAGRIIIAASCFSKWDEYVSGAVMTYYPNKVKKNYFDGTIQIPQYVRCEAFNIKEGTELPPCRSCHNLFGLSTDGTQVWPYGNCAEAESLSNLLKNEEDVKKETRVSSAGDRQKAEDEVLRELKKVLNSDTIKFNTWTGEYYSPE